MYINPQDLLYVVATICLLWITGFLCWALYETARLMRQSNEVVSDVREKVEAVEEFVDDAMDKVSSLSSYLGVLSSAGGKVMGMLNRGADDDDEPRRPRKKARKLLKELEDEI
jgi:hypothetical protein